MFQHCYSVTLAGPGKRKENRHQMLHLPLKFLYFIEQLHSTVSCILCSLVHNLQAMKSNVHRSNFTVSYVTKCTRNDTNVHWSNFTVSSLLLSSANSNELNKFLYSMFRFLFDVSMLLNHLAEDFGILVRLFLKST